jgi:hypothetical protein
MSSHVETPDENETSFTLGVDELRRAKAARKPAAEPQIAEPRREDPGVDPYNTSGSFDRSKAWTRVGKR